MLGFGWVVRFLFKKRVREGGWCDCWFLDKCKKGEPVWLARRGATKSREPMWLVGCGATKSREPMWLVGCGAKKTREPVWLVRFLIKKTRERAWLGWLFGEE